MNNVTLIGRIGNAPELRYTPNNTAVCTFSVALSERWKDSSGETQERTSWVDCEAWARTGEVINQHFTKGQRIGIVGALRQDKWQDKDGSNRSRLKVIVSSFDFIESKNDRDAAPGSPRRENDRQPARGAGTRHASDAWRAETTEPVDESEIPF